MTEEKASLLSRHLNFSSLDGVDHNCEIQEYMLSKVVFRIGLMLIK